MSIIEYGKKYTEFKKTEIGVDKETELMAMRNDFIHRGKETLIVAIEKCVDYDGFNDSAILKDFVNRTKWLLIEPTDDKIKEWNDKNPMELNARDNRHCLENLVIATLTRYVCDYLQEIYESVEV